MSKSKDSIQAQSSKSKFILFYHLDFGFDLTFELCNL